LSSELSSSDSSSNSKSSASVAAILVAGGSGARFGHETPKQFLMLKAYEMYIWSLSILYSSDSISDIVVTMPAGFEEAGRKRIAEVFGNGTDSGQGNCSRQSRVHVVTGGATRQQSVLNALNHLKAISSESGQFGGTGESGKADMPLYKYVLVHDAARPFISAKIVEDTVQLVTTRGACTVGTPVSDTLKKVVDGLIIETVDRSQLYAVQTPQAAPFDLLLACHEKAAELGIGVTDDAAILEHFGHKVLILPGQNNNIKITVAEDLRAGELLAPLFLPARPI